ncbi:DUF1622 domain-containing protein [Thiohalomonas denitrificans]|uniref:DUF1622 domain-containing protein n=1 Tax=Thiohalomonas denitrificans TaxID=415747 RepID=UPI0026EEB1A2|nr:DUF1622 domain-containing protein [Thiohalomonas denitrificans]
MEDVRTLIEYAGLALEFAGMVVIVLGAAYATAQAIRLWFGATNRNVIFLQFRIQLGRGILLGLEFLVAGDIINTIAIEPSYNSVGVLAAIVLVRTFLSFTLEVEMTGRWPWQAEPGRP